MRGQRARIDPLAGTERAEQLALGGIDVDLRTQVRRKRDPVAIAAQAVAAVQQLLQVETDLLARFHEYHRAASNLHCPSSSRPPIRASHCACNPLPGWKQDGRPAMGRPPFSNHEGIHMQTAVPESRNTAPLGSQVMDGLLDLLSTDDALSNPREALAQVGFVRNRPHRAAWALA